MWRAHVKDACLREHDGRTAMRTRSIDVGDVFITHEAAGIHGLQPHLTESLAF